MIRYGCVVLGSVPASRAVRLEVVASTVASIAARGRSGARRTRRVPASQVPTARSLGGSRQRLRSVKTGPRKSNRLAPASWQINAQVHAEIRGRPTSMTASEQALLASGGASRAMGRDHPPSCQRQHAAAGCSDSGALGHRNAPDQASQNAAPCGSWVERCREFSGQRGCGGDTGSGS